MGVEGFLRTSYRLFSGMARQLQLCRDSGGEYVQRTLQNGIFTLLIARIGEVSPGQYRTPCNLVTHNEYWGICLGKTTTQKEIIAREMRRACILAQRESGVPSHFAHDSRLGRWSGKRRANSATDRTVKNPNGEGETTSYAAEMSREPPDPT
jgi:hypothetical protein